MRVAVTGGTGCLGMPILAKLHKAGLEVNLLALPGDRAAAQFGEDVRIVTGDLSYKDILKILTKDCQAAFHLAGKVHTVPKTTQQKHDFFRVNLDGTKNLVQACAENHVERVVFFSTVGVYGRDSDFHGDELSACDPVSTYAKSKYEAESIVLDSEKNCGPQGVVLRLPVVYGPLDRGNVLKLIRAIDRKKFFYFGDGRCLRSMISSVNAAEAAMKAAFENFDGSQVFCVTDGRDYQLKELVECICRSLNMEWRPFHIPLSVARQMGKIGGMIERISRKTLPISSATVMKLSSSFTFSYEKAKNILRYKPMETLSEGIEREVAWFLGS